MMTKTLTLQFVNEAKKAASVSINNVKEPLDQADVHAAMDAIIANNVFITDGGFLIEKKGARITERQVTDIELA
ncbi:DUF2922 domain-containing protein [Metabacillus iocasae]|uniref:DUF2922 domain-containing protein n=1 Tax=Priestia iocasae TaxID=2291674 RepID=A0ABS2QUK2_9BACI|nr:DUF2922 domain-containing protein [Metabacillus iocasae]MBM7702968.1 hypothetical protein [Metabacillus iocasae]